MAAALVIVNYRSAADSLACIEAVRRTADPPIAEIVVVDNASGDDSVETLRRDRPDVRVIARDTNDGFAAGVNAGVAATESELVLVLNPDSRVLDGAVDALLGRLESDPRLGVTGPLLLEDDGSPRLDAYKAWPSLWSLFVSLCLPVGHLLMGTPAHPEVRTRKQIAQHRPVARVCGSVLAFRREAWTQAGPMDEGYFMYFEEVEWQQRVAAEGWEIAMTPQARAVHLVQGGRVAETAPPAYVRSALRYHSRRGVPVPVVRAVVVAALGVSELTLLAAGLVPGLREKSRRMREGFRALRDVARSWRP